MEVGYERTEEEEEVLPDQGLKLGSGLTLGNELSKETHVLTKQEILLGKGTRVESRRTALPCRSLSGFMAMG